MQFIRELFRNDPTKKVPFSETIQDKTDKYDIALSFSSILEMIKQSKLEAEQKRLFGEIMVSAGSRIDEEPVAEEQAALEGQVIEEQ